MTQEQEWQKNLTIIIPTYNSPDFLRRNLSYLDSFHLKLTVFVADSSREENKTTNRKIIADIKHLKITYLGRFSSDIKPFLKWLKVLETVRTKYVVLCADDDFISISGLKASLDFFQENRDYTAVEGKNIYFVNLKLGRKSFFCWRTGDAWHSFEGNSLLRLHDFFLNYQPLLYAIYRTNDLVRFFKLAEKNDFLEYPFGEFLSAFAAVINGKIKRLNTFYSARDKTIDFQRMPQINFIQQYKEDGSFGNRYSSFREPLISEFSRLSEISKGLAEKKVDTELQLFFKSQRSAKYVAFLNKLFGKHFVYHNFSKIYSIVKWLVINPVHWFMLKKLVEENNDIKRIKWFVKHYPIPPAPKIQTFIK